MPHTPALPAASGRHVWRRYWLPATALAAVVMTVLDALLLQRRKSFFTGGFLTDIYTRSVAEAAGFLTVSLVADFAVAGVGAALALLAVGRLRLTRAARLFVVFVGGTAPLVAADIVLYQLREYFGDDRAAGVLWDLVDRKTRELFPVLGPQVVELLLLGLAAAVAGVLIVWIVQRVSRAARTPVAAPIRRLLPGAALLIVLGTGVSLARAASEMVDDGMQRKPSGKAIASVLELVSDVDRDGYGLGGDFRDPAPFDGTIHPFALDSPGNGVDEDGVAGDLPAGTAPYAGSSTLGRFDHHPNVVLILLESFRADAVGRVVNGRPVTPVLDALAARGVSAPLAYSQNGYTAQSRFHTFAGSFVPGVRTGSLVDDFKANGYEVGYFSAQDESFGGDEYTVGFDRADVHYDARQDPKKRYTTNKTPGSLAVPFDVLLQRVDAFLAGRSEGRPLFLYLNFHDTHFPYHHSAMQPLVSDVALSQGDIVPGRAAEVQAQYYNAAANVDRAIGEALARVERALGTAPAVVVASDHGESLFDSGFLGHGYALNDEQTRIPLIAAGLPLTITEPFGQVELRDAIAAALCATPGTPPQVTVDAGKSIFQYLGKIDRPRQIAFTSTEGRIIYDFRTDRVSAPGLPHPVHPSALSGPEQNRFVELVRQWERMALAYAGAATSRSHTH